MIVVYALYNGDRGKIYIGSTEDLPRRLARHNGQLPSRRTSYTRRNQGQWVAAHQESHPNRRAAVKREKELKTARGRKFIWQIIGKKNTARP